MENDPHLEIRARLKKFGVRVINLVDALPRRRSADTIGRQLLRSGTSVGANYRAARRARSKAEFISKLGICEEEADETLHWLEMLVDAKLVPAQRLQPLMQEAEEILRIIVASIKTARGRGS
jgi:four helix bundle protein